MVPDQEFIRLVLLASTTYPVTVGKGGGGVPGSGHDQDGDDSVFNSLTAGGGGAGGRGAGNGESGRNGGCGGGGGAGYPTDAKVVVLQWWRWHPGSGTDVASPDDGWGRGWWRWWFSIIPHLVEVVVV